MALHTKLEEYKLEVRLKLSWSKSYRYIYLANVLTELTFIFGSFGMTRLFRSLFK